MVLETYHGEYDSTLGDELGETRLRGPAQGLEGVAARHCPVRIEQIQGSFAGKVLLEVAGHGQAHGAEAILLRWWDFSMGM